MADDSSRRAPEGVSVDHLVLHVPFARALLGTTVACFLASFALLHLRVVPVNRFADGLPAWTTLLVLLILIVGFFRLAWWGAVVALGWLMAVQWLAFLTPGQRVHIMGDRFRPGPFSEVQFIAAPDLPPQSTVDLLMAVLALAGTAAYFRWRFWAQRQRIRALAGDLPTPAASSRPGPPLASTQPAAPDTDLAQQHRFWQGLVLTPAYGLVAMLLMPLCQWLAFIRVDGVPFLRFNLLLRHGNELRFVSGCFALAAVAILVTVLLRYLLAQRMTPLQATIYLNDVLWEEQNEELDRAARSAAAQSAQEARRS